MNSNAQFNMIAELDLDPIKVKLMHKESGEGWSLEQANAVEFEYRRFLCLMKLFPHEQTAPLFDVDIFWHYHILDTIKYAADCEQIFGYFLHHFPYVGLRGEEDEEAHHRVGARMQELYEATFGDAYIRQKRGYPARANMAHSVSVAQGDGVYSMRPVLGTAKTAHSVSVSVAQNDDSYSVRPVLETAKTAHSVSVSVAQNHGSYSARPVLETAKTAHSVSVSVAQNDGSYSVRPVLGTARTAHSVSVSVAQNDGSYSARPVLQTAKTAHSVSVSVAQNDRFYSTRPLVAIAA